MAPEQLFRVRSDKCSDIYAFGAILYQLTTGRLPFGRPAHMRQVSRRVWRDPVPPRNLRPETPAVLQEIIRRCLEPVPDGRYRAATIARCLSTIATHEEKCSFLIGWSAMPIRKIPGMHHYGYGNADRYRM